MSGDCAGLLLDWACQRTCARELWGRENPSAHCTRRSPGFPSMDAGSIPATSTTVCPHHALTPEGPGRQTGPLMAAPMPCARRCAARRLPGRRAACGRRAPPAQPGDDGDIDCATTPQPRSGSGRRDLAHWRSAFGRWLVRVAFTVFRWSAAHWVLVLTAAVGGVIAVVLTAASAEVYEAVAESRRGRGSRPARARPGDRRGAAPGSTRPSPVHRRRRPGGHADPRDGGHPGHGAGLAVVDADAAHGDRGGRIARDDRLGQGARSDGPGRRWSEPCRPTRTSPSVPERAHPQRHGGHGVLVYLCCAGSTAPWARTARRRGRCPLRRAPWG